MTDQHPDELLDLLRRWLPKQRWFPFADGGAAADLRVVAQLELPEREGATARVLLVEASEEGRAELLQVPLTFRGASPQLQWLHRTAVAPDHASRRWTVDLHGLDVSVTGVPC